MIKNAFELVALRHFAFYADIQEVCKLYSFRRNREVVIIPAVVEQRAPIALHAGDGLVIKNHIRAAWSESEQGRICTAPAE